MELRRELSEVHYSYERGRDYKEDEEGPERDASRGSSRVLISRARCHTMYQKKVRYR
jgi:hypothetical protein